MSSENQSIVKAEVEITKPQNLDFQDSSDLIIREEERFIIQLTPEQEAKCKEKLGDVLTHLDRCETNPKALRELLEKFAAAGGILSEAKPGCAMDDIIPTLQKYLKQFNLNPTSESLDKLNELIELGQIIKRQEAALSEDKKIISNGGEMLLVVLQSVVGGTPAKVDEKTKMRLFLETALEPLNSGKAVLEKLGEQCPIELKRYLKTFPKNAGEVTENKIYEIVLHLYAEYAKASLESDLSVALGESLVHVLGIDDENIKKENDPGKKKKLISDECKQYIKDILLKEKEKINEVLSSQQQKLENVKEVSQKARAESASTKTILEFKRLGFLERFAFHFTLTYNKMFPESIRPQKSKITNNIFLGRIPEKFDDLPGPPDHIPFGEKDMVLAVVEPGEILEANDHRYFEALQKAGVKHHLIPMKDHGSAVNKSAAQNGLAQMHNAISAGGKVYVHCKAGRTRSAVMLAALLILVAKNIIENKKNGRTQKEYPGYKDFIDAFNIDQAFNTNPPTSDSDLADFVIKFLMDKRPQVDINENEKNTVLSLIEDVYLKDLEEGKYTIQDKKHDVVQGHEYKQLQAYKSNNDKDFVRVQAVRAMAKYDVKAIGAQEKQRAYLLMKQKGIANQHRGNKKLPEELESLFEKFQRAIKTMLGLSDLPPPYEKPETRLSEQTNQPVNESRQPIAPREHAVGSNVEMLNFTEKPNQASPAF